MSNIFGPIIGDLLGPYAIVGGYPRSIGTLIPDVVIEEMHRDELQITIHPVETGNPITDHSFKMPATVEMRCAWSDSSAQAAGYVQEVYQQFLQLQASREPFNVSTVKRQYENMLVRSLMVKTDETSEFALMCVAILQEVILTGVQTTGGSSPTEGSTSLGNTSTDSIAQQASASGYTSVDSQGNVTWPNGVSAGGSYAISGATPPSWGQSAASINPSWGQTSSTLYSGGGIGSQ